mgnify:CR=1 FL=1
MAAVAALWVRGISVGTPGGQRAQSPRESVMAVAASQIGTQEATGHNDGPVVKYLTSVGLAKGDPYCAAFVYWCGREALGAGNPFPRSGWSPDMVNRPDWLRGKGRLPEPGDTFGIYFASKGRVAHTGLVAAVGRNSLTTIEANTSPQPASGEADRNGDGVWRKIRPLSTIHSTKRWLP